MCIFICVWICTVSPVCAYQCMVRRQECDWWWLVMASCHGSVSSNWGCDEVVMRNDDHEDDF